MTTQITRAKRTDVYGEPVVAYYRDATAKLVYRYPDATWLYTDADQIIGRYDSVRELEAAVVGML